MACDSSPAPTKNPIDSGVGLTSIKPASSFVLKSRFAGFTHTLQSTALLRKAGALLLSSSTFPAYKTYLWMVYHLFLLALTFYGVRRAPTMTRAQANDGTTFVLAFVSSLNHLGSYFLTPEFSMTNKNFMAFFVFVILFGRFMWEQSPSHTLVQVVILLPALWFLDFTKWCELRQPSGAARGPSSLPHHYCGASAFMDYMLAHGLLLALMGLAAASVSGLSLARHRAKQLQQAKEERGGSQSWPLPFEDVLGTRVVSALRMRPLLEGYERMLARVAQTIDEHYLAMAVCYLGVSFHFMRIILSRFGVEGASIAGTTPDEWLVFGTMAFVLGRSSNDLDAEGLTRHFKHHLAATHALLSDLMPAHIVKNLLSKADGAATSATPPPPAAATVLHPQQQHLQSNKRLQLRRGSSDVAWATMGFETHTPLQQRHSQKVTRVTPQGFTSQEHLPAAAPLLSSDEGIATDCNAQALIPALSIPLTGWWPLGSSDSAAVTAVATGTGVQAPVAVTNAARVTTGAESPVLLSREHSIISEGLSERHGDAPARSRSNSQLQASCSGPFMSPATFAKHFGKLRVSLRSSRHKALEDELTATGVGNDVIVVGNGVSVSSPLSQPASARAQVSTDIEDRPPAPDPLSDNMAMCHPCVTVFFSDIVGFSTWSRDLPPAQVLRTLSDLFSQLDDILLNELPSLYKVETIGDAYIVAANLLVDDPDHAATAIRFAVRAQQVAAKVMRPDIDDGTSLQLRIGLHSGPLVSGLCGKVRRRFTLLGATMNWASRAESTCPIGGIQLTAATHDLAKPTLDSWTDDDGRQMVMEERGDVLVKGADAPIKMYLVKQSK